MTLGAGISRTPLPLGFFAAGINSGVRKYRPDLGLLWSDRPAVAVGVFTRNECKAAPILYSQKLVPATDVRAIVTNSGQANAATGEAGIQTNLAMAEAVARAVGCAQNQVLTASTGVIGVPLDIEKITAAIPELMDRGTTSGESFALAILTTDLVPKTITTTVQLTQGLVRITGIVKGSGMIHPNMGTMLGYLLTDAAVPVDVAEDLLKASNEDSFNMISVDGDTSTNDCVFLLANGAANVTLATDSDYQSFKKALFEVSQVLAQAIARDGEGATRLIEVSIKGCSDHDLARKAARGITVSPLIKTAIHGEDPNWGRILARLGAEGVPAHELNHMSLKLQGHQLFLRGAPCDFDRALVRTHLRSETVKIEIDLFSGPFAATAWGCDLSKKYVEINTEYST